MPKQDNPSNELTAAADFEPVYQRVSAILAEARGRAWQAVNSAMVAAYWEIGRTIVEAEQCGQSRAAYGANLLAQLSRRLTDEFGKGFDRTNLQQMRNLDLAYSNCDALRHELSPFQLICMARRDTFPISRRGASRIEVHAPANGIRQPHR